MSVQARSSLTFVKHNFINNVLYSREYNDIVMDFRRQSLNIRSILQVCEKQNGVFVSPLQTESVSKLPPKKNKEALISLPTYVCFYPVSGLVSSPYMAFSLLVSI